MGQAFYKGWQDADIVLVTIVIVSIPDGYHIGEC